MKELLKDISKIAIELKEEQIVFSNEQIKNIWIGYNPSNDNEIINIEKKLGITLPKEYKEFMKITNGFSQSTITEPEFYSIDKIDWLKNVDDELINIWKENGLKDIGEQLERAIIVADSNKEQQFLLISSIGNKEWKFWKFGNWIPGEEEYENLENYFEKTLEFLIEIKNEFK
ncbi:MAG: SMI1/KNR4 family protein [Flavobacteriales bacterium]